MDREAPVLTPPRLLSLDTANPKRTCTQQELLELLQCSEPKIRRLFEPSHIAKRHLVLPDPGPDGPSPDEDGEGLLDKHLEACERIDSPVA